MESPAESQYRPRARERIYRGRFRVEDGRHEVCVDGWRPLGNITIGSRVAAPRHTPGPLAERPMPEPEIIMLAHLLGDGSFVRSQPIRRTRPSCCAAAANGQAAAPLRSPMNSRRCIAAPSFVC